MAPTGDDVAGPPLDARVVRTRNDILRAALDVLTEQGLDAVTHHHLAEVAGYSRATIYKHWPTRNDLLRDAFAHRASAPHHVPAGDLRADLIAELTMFRRAMERHRLDRALATLVALTTSIPELAEVRDRLVTEGERILLQLLTPVAHGPELEAAMRMLSGSIVQSALLHGQLPSDEVIAATVDLLLRGLDAAPSLASLADYRRGVRAELAGHSAFPSRSSPVSAGMYVRCDSDLGPRTSDTPGQRSFLVTTGTLPGAVVPGHGVARSCPDYQRGRQAAAQHPECDWRMPSHEKVPVNQPHGGINPSRSQ